MPNFPKLSDNSVYYLLQELANLKLYIANKRADFSEAYQFVFVCRRYFSVVFSKMKYSYYLGPISSTLRLEPVDHNIHYWDEPGCLVIIFFIREVNESIRQQMPILTLLKLVTVMPEVEPLGGRDGYSVLLEVRNDKMCRNLTNALFDRRIPFECLPGTFQVAVEEFYDRMSSDFDYHPHILSDGAKVLSYIASNPDDPRVFREVCLLNGNDGYNYNPNILNIKTEQLTIHFNNIPYLKTFPSMPYLKRLVCHFAPLGVYNKHPEEEYYEEISEKLARSAPNLEELQLTCEINVFSDKQALAEEGAIKVGLALHHSLKGLKAHLSVVKPEVQLFMRLTDYDMFERYENLTKYFQDYIQDYFDRNGIIKSFDWEEDITMDVYAEEDYQDSDNPETNYLIIKVFGGFLD